MLESKLNKKRKQTIQEYKMFLVKEMFNWIGVEYSDEFVIKEDWYMENEWSAETELDFRDWMIKDIRSLGITKKTAMIETDMFLLNYGWKTKRDE